MNCRGHNLRQKIVAEYEVHPEAHIKLLANQQKRSDANATIENEYYVFSAKRKSDGKKEVIQCGMGAARDFLELIEHKGLPLFNPLVGDNHVNNRLERLNRGEDLQTEEWNETAKQLYNAIMWLIMLWDARPDTPLFDLKDEVYKHKNYEPFESKIKSVNTVIKNGGRGKTLTEMINYYREDNNFRDEICNFGILQQKISALKDKQGNTIESYF